MNRKSAFGLVLTILLFSALAGCGPSLKRFEVLEKALAAEKEKQEGAQKKTLSWRCHLRLECLHSKNHMGNVG